MLSQSFSGLTQQPYSRICLSVQESSTVRCCHGFRCYKLCRVQGCHDLHHISYIAHQQQGFSCRSLVADAAETRAADQQMQELIVAEEKPQAKKKSKQKKVRHSCHVSLMCIS